MKRVRTYLVGRRVHAMRLARAWWFDKLDTLAHGDVRPTLVWMGLLLVGWGIIVMTAPAVKNAPIYQLFQTFYPDMLGFLALGCGVILLIRSRSNGWVWVAAMIVQAAWWWALIAITVSLGVTTATWIYLILILRSWWIVYRVLPGG